MDKSKWVFDRTNTNVNWVWNGFLFTSREPEHGERKIDLLNEMNIAMKAEITIPTSLAFEDKIPRITIDTIEWIIKAIPLLINHGSRYNRLRWNENKQVVAGGCRHLLNINYVSCVLEINWRWNYIELFMCSLCATIDWLSGSGWNLWRFFYPLARSLSLSLAPAFA